MKRQLLGVLGLALSFAVLGCGSSGGPSPATQTACSNWCAAYISAACTDPQYTSLADCQSGECDVIPSTISASCDSALKTWYDCRNGEADICADTDCDSQFSAVFSNCQ